MAVQNNHLARESSLPRVALSMNALSNISLSGIPKKCLT